ncbi:hypothetical protein BDR26DRAFT_625174 [Obelidium mucronatum]|nr:hypothetical protein BDR26DRAFT_625174 [Obelidium mucronatum]
MIQAQEEQQINAMEKERQLNGRLPCEKCEGRGFSHPIDNLKIHDRAPTVECKFCRTCAICCGTGLFLDTTSCLDCQSLGYIHPNEPYSCRNTGACIGCISCKTCRGTGVHQKTGLTPRLSLVSLTASVASLAKKKNGGGIGGKSGSSVNIMRPRAASNGIVISSPSEFRKLAAGRMAENGGVSPSESRLFHHQNSGIIGDASDMVVSVSGILREAAALGDLPMRIPSAILAVPGAGRVPTRNQMDDDSRSLEGEENDDEDEDGSDDEERDVTADGDDLLKRLQEKEAMGSGSTLPEDAVFSNGP